MKIVYLSISGSVQQFIGKLNLNEDEIFEIDDNNCHENINDKYLIIVPTYDKLMTECANDFIETNKVENCVGIIGSGNMNFGEDFYIFTAKDLCKEYNLPLLYDFEYSGLDSDVKEVNKIIKKYKMGEN